MSSASSTKGLAGAVVFHGLDPTRGNFGALISLDFEDHRAARKVVQPAFTLKASEGYLEAAGPLFDETIDAWVARGRVDLKANVRSLLARLASRIFLGFRNEEESAEIDRILDAFWRGLLAFPKDARFSRTFRRAGEALQALLTTLRALVPERRRCGGDDVFSHLCQGAEADAEGDERLVRIFISIMFGAFDTTSNALTSMGYLLAKHPDWQSRLREENAKFDGENLKSLRETEWVWKETLRLMPVAAAMPRVPLRDTEIGGYRVAAGTLVIAHFGGICGTRSGTARGRSETPGDLFAIRRRRAKHTRTPLGDVSLKLTPLRNECL